MTLTPDEWRSLEVWYKRCQEGTMRCNDVYALSLMYPRIYTQLKQQLTQKEEQAK